MYFFADLSVHPVSYYNSFFLARDKSQKFNPKLTKIINFWYIWLFGGHKRVLPGSPERLFEVSRKSTPFRGLFFAHLDLSIAPLIHTASGIFLIFHTLAQSGHAGIYWYRQLDTPGRAEADDPVPGTHWYPQPGKPERAEVDDPIPGTRWYRRPGRP